jgi:hypothetical protein
MRVGFVIHKIDEESGKRTNSDRVARRTIQGSNPGRGKRFYLSAATPAAVPTQSLFGGLPGLGRETTDAHLMRGSRMSGCVPPLPLHALMACVVEKFTFLPNSIDRLLILINSVFSVRYGQNCCSL